VTQLKQLVNKMETFVPTRTDPGQFEPVEFEDHTLLPNKRLVPLYWTDKLEKGGLTNLLLLCTEIVPKATITPN
jgi:hypothetical protein